MNNNPKVSVVIPQYNLGQYIGETIASVESQTYKEWELIIVDDGSTDKKTIEFMKILKKTKPTILIIEQKNQGVEVARNNGIEKAQGEYVICLDADDILAPKYIEKTIRVLLEDKKNEIGFVTTWVREFGSRKNLWKTGDFDIPSLLMNNNIHAASIFRKEAWKKSGGYNNSKPTGYEDWEFWISIIEKGYKWATIHEELFGYRIREGSGLQFMKENHASLYSKLYNNHIDLFRQYSKDIINGFSNESDALHRKQKELNLDITNKDKIIEQLQKNNEKLQQENYIKQDELNHIVNSRLISKVIIFRNFLGNIRNRLSKIKTIPKNLLHIIRVVFAPFIPGFLRKKSKNVYNKIRKYIIEKRTKPIYLINSRWKHGPLVSVVIPYYNRGDTIDSTIKSLVSQTFSDFKIIIVDDGSTDEASIEKLKEIQANYSEILIISQNNQGVAMARNNGIQAAKGKYIVCLDSDDLLGPTFIEKCIVVLETQPDVSFVTTYMDIFGVQEDIFKHAEYNPIDLYSNNMVITAAAFKKEDWRAVGGYKSEIGYEDWEFWINLNENGYFGRQIKEHLFNYRTSFLSRYIEDKSNHYRNGSVIKSLHPRYIKNTRKILEKNKYIKNILEPKTSFINLSESSSYMKSLSKRILQETLVEELC